MTAGAGTDTRGFGRSAGLLSAGIGAAGLLTYLFFSLASHNLGAAEYGEIVVLWSAIFVTISVAYRPVEQLLTRSVAERRARGQEISGALRIALALQGAIALALAGIVLALREPLQDELLSGNETLYWVMLASVVAFAASFYARGLLAGSRRFSALAALLLGESGTRAVFALAVALGIASGQDAIAVGVAAAPAVGLLAVPILVARATRGGGPEPARKSLGMAAGGGFAAAVFVVMLSEQVFLNAGPLLLRGFVDAAAAGFIFNVLMVVRAPVLLFQGVAMSLLPHLTRLRARGPGEEREFQSSIGMTLRAVAVFGAATVLALAAVGPQLMQIAFGDDFEYGRVDLVIVGVGMAFYLAATTLNQSALARGAAAQAARRWALAAGAFLAWCLLPLVGDEALRVEIGFTAAAGLLAAMLARIHPTGEQRAIAPDSPEELEARLAAAEEAG